MKNISIKIQVLSLVVVSLVTLSTLLTFASVNASKDALMKKSYDGLTSARDSKANQIQNFFAERIGDINVMSKSKNVKELVDDLIHVREVLEVEDNVDFPVSNPLTKEKTALHEDFFSKLC